MNDDHTTKVRDIILQLTNEGRKFWTKANDVLTVQEPLVKVLRLVDGDEKPTMGFLYKAIEREKLAILKNCRYWKCYWKIIDNRWNFQLHHDLHAVGYFLNPQFVYGSHANDFREDREVMRWLKKVIQRLEPNIENQIQALNEALAQDQLRALLTMTGGFGTDLNIGIYDGDTSQADRILLRDNTRLLITNPDMLHVSILPCHAQFKRILSNLRFVIIDEAHCYKGAFGCHTALILRRLRRLCSHVYGSDPSFVFCTATSANPKEHAMELANLQTLELIQKDGSPSGPKLFLLWNPPLCFKNVSKRAASGKNLIFSSVMKRSSPILEVSCLLAEMVQHGLRCIGFCKTRKLCELVLSYTHEILQDSAPHLVNSVCAYRAGYVAEKMPSRSISIRSIESEKFKVIDEQKDEVIEEIEESRAFFQVYEGAVYMNQGRSYLVTTLDLSSKVAYAKEADLKYYTKTRDYTDIHVVGGDIAYPASASSNRCSKATAQAHCCKVTTIWFGFYRIWKGSNQVFDTVELSLPEYSYESQAVWIRVPQQVKMAVEIDEKLQFRAGLHAASHAVLNVVPLFIICNSSDLAPECANPRDTRYFPERILLYDQHPGGNGLSQQIQQVFTEMLTAALELLTSCCCIGESGCPDCVQSLACHEYNEVLHKDVAIMIIKGVLEEDTASV